MIFPSFFLWQEFPFSTALLDIGWEIRESLERGASEQVPAEASMGLLWLGICYSQIHWGILSSIKSKALKPLYGCPAVLQTQAQKLKSHGAQWGFSSTN